MRAHRLKSAWDKILVGVRQAEDGETKDEDARHTKCSDSYSSLFVLHGCGIILPGFLVLAALDQLAALGSAFLISAASSMRGFMQLPGWPTLNGGESVAKL